MPIQKINVHQFLTMGKSIPTLDVRSPGEYNYAHIPEAVSFPIFDDEQRKEIGTTYKQVSREDAIKIGLEYFGPRLRSFIERAELLTKEQDSPRKLLVHCWRGGMRSGAMAWLLSFYGFDVYLLEGGYKSYRHWVLAQLELPFQLNVLGGYTGSGKTEVLQELEKNGLPVINLEKIARHKGSAFGSLNRETQPSQEFFENLQVAALTAFYEVSDEGVFHQTQPVWIENESRRIGHINLTEHFYNRMQAAPLYVLEIPFEERLRFITSVYGGYDKEKLVNAIIRIQKRLGGLDTKTSINFLLENNVQDCFGILLKYYDKQYLQSMERSGRTAMHSIHAETVDPVSITKNLLHVLSR